jgi:hypothetical protein
MFGGLVRLVLGQRRFWLRTLKLFFDYRLPRHSGFSVTLLMVPTPIQRISCGTALVVRFRLSDTELTSPGRSVNLSACRSIFSISAVDQRQERRWCAYGSNPATTKD